MPIFIIHITLLSLTLNGNLRELGESNMKQR
ncbi:hypothetical protein CPS_1421 [Colwellia psychrerythraea 34H]|uniref:Uncharacterized protein n=1 Tax=Colwellia psychrerythraea (strain 34H / ATCC BAA-681) TaxID=167879 RepID=Q485V1_COLP3|nr:hypothetical protein CPS_1421 [Colwellia psychrerythraea 34H]